jgi:hypothetical protein
MNWQEQPLQQLENEEPLFYIHAGERIDKKTHRSFGLSNKRIIRELLQQNILQQLSLNK